MVNILINYSELEKSVQVFDKAYENHKKKCTEICGDIIKAIIKGLGLPEGNIVLICNNQMHGPKGLDLNILFWIEQGAIKYDQNYNATFRAKINIQKHDFELDFKIDRDNKEYSAFCTQSNIQHDIEHISEFANDIGQYIQNEIQNKVRRIKD